MDGGVRQEEMVERLKREIKENAHLRRRGERVSSHPVDNAKTPIADPMVMQQNLPKCLPSPICDRSLEKDGHNNVTKPLSGISTISPRDGLDCTLLNKDARENMTLGGSDTILLTFYLEHLHPFLFPFYRPSILEGGRAWILEMLVRSPVIRQTALCQSSYFFSLARGSGDSNVLLWETVLAQTREAFGMLGQALQIIDDVGVAEHLHGAVRILASIMQVQRFEIAVLSFDNCKAHLNAASALLNQLLDSSGTIEPARSRSSFDIISSRLGPPSWISPAQGTNIPSGELAAFRFSSTLLIFDDIVASTVLQERPRLYEYHRGLLDNIDGSEPPIQLETVVGCQNCALLAIGEIAVLDAWKQQCKRAGNLNVIDLVHRATAIKDVLEAHLLRLENDPVGIRGEPSGLLDIFKADFGNLLGNSVSQSTLVTRVWGHAALLYLFVVVSGWQPANVEVRYHIDQIVELLTTQISPPALLRTMAWPFCVAGCLAEPAVEDHFRGMVEALQPPSVFGTIRKAYEIMENAWRNRNAEDACSRDLAMCFRSQGDLVLLV